MQKIKFWAKKVRFAPGQNLSGTGWGRGHKLCKIWDEDRDGDRILEKRGPRTGTQIWKIRDRGQGRRQKPQGQTTRGQTVRG